MNMERSESIITKGFLVNHKRILSSYRWFIMATFGLCGIIKVAQAIIELLPTILKKGCREFSTIRLIIYNVVDLSRCVVVIFALDWAAFAEYFEQLSQMELEKDEASVKQINRERKIKNWFCSISLISYTAICMTHFFTHQRKFPLYQLSVISADFTLITCNFFLVYLVVDLSICLKAAFEFVNRQMSDFLEITSPNSMLVRLRNNRLSYSCVVRASQEAEKFARHYIGWFYFQLILLSVVNIVIVLGEKAGAGFAFVLFMVLDIINSAYITVKLVSVNKVSTEGMEDLYEISYELKSYNLQNENNLFLNRMLWQNVGFTFSNLFLINPNFITSLLSFILTITISLATFLYS